MQRNLHAEFGGKLLVILYHFIDINDIGPGSLSYLFMQFYVLFLQK